MHQTCSAIPGFGQLADMTQALLRFLHNPLIDDFLSLWPSQALPGRRPAPAILPVLRWLPACTTPAPLAAELCAALRHLGPMLEWRQTYTKHDFGLRFLERYGWTELVGQRGPFPSDRLAVGFLLLGPDTEYPPHRHEAEEIYIPLSGQALWLKGESGWLPRQPGEVIHHAPWTSHAMCTQQDPLLALYLWRGGDLTQKSLIG